jgi:hypothetical protein
MTQEETPSQAIEPWRQMLIDTMLSVDREHPDNGYLKRDAELLAEGGLGHLDTWIVIETFARFEEQARAATEAAAIERCAVVTEKVSPGMAWDGLFTSYRDKIASAIRTLAPDASTDGRG